MFQNFNDGLNPPKTSIKLDTNFAPFDGPWKLHLRATNRAANVGAQASIPDLQPERSYDIDLTTQVGTALKARFTARLAPPGTSAYAVGTKALHLTITQV